jgi:hypothetical protein
MEELNFIETLLVNLFLIIVWLGCMIMLYAKFKDNQIIRSKNRYIKVLERKIKGSD